MGASSYLARLELRPAPGEHDMRSLVNPAVVASAVPAPSGAAAPFHAALEGYRPTPVRGLAAAGLAIGDCGAAPLAGLRALAGDPRCAALRQAAGLDSASRALPAATEGLTDPDAYRRALAA
jgi:hypothetical protein